MQSFFAPTAYAQVTEHSLTAATPPYNFNILQFKFFFLCLKKKKKSGLVWKLPDPHSLDQDAADPQHPGVLATDIWNQIPL